MWLLCSSFSLLSQMMAFPLWKASLIISGEAFNWPYELEAFPTLLMKNSITSDYHKASLLSSSSSVVYTLFCNPLITAILWPVLSLSHTPITWNTRNLGCHGLSTTSRSKYVVLPFYNHWWLKPVQSHCKDAKEKEAMIGLRFSHPWMIEYLYIGTIGLAYHSSLRCWGT